MWLLVFAVIAFIVWHFIPKRDPNQPSPRYRSVAKREDCESPAEDAFLQAITVAYDLKPTGRSFSGSGLNLSLQVEEGRYRADFLANDWLIIEVDGATYHSSPEAMSRDRARDRYFEGLGYSVIRIPAKVVFNNPQEAVSRVRNALEIGKRPTPKPVEKSGWQRLSETMTAVSDSVSRIDATLSRQVAVQSALEQAEAAFAWEQTLIEGAVKGAEAERKVAKRCAEDPTYNKFYEEAHARYTNLLVQQGKKGDSPCVDKQTVLSFPSAPLGAGNPEYDEAIENAYFLLSLTRESFFTHHAKKFAVDPWLQEQVLAKLKAYNAVACIQTLRTHIGLGAPPVG